MPAPLSLLFLSFQVLPVVLPQFVHVQVWRLLVLLGTVGRLLPLQTWLFQPDLFPFVQFVVVQLFLLLVRPPIVFDRRPILLFHVHIFLVDVSIRLWLLLRSFPVRCVLLVPIYFFQRFYVPVLFVLLVPISFFQQFFDRFLLAFWPFQQLVQFVSLPLLFVPHGCVLVLIFQPLPKLLLLPLLAALPTPFAPPLAVLPRLAVPPLPIPQLLWLAVLLVLLPMLVVPLLVDLPKLFVLLRMSVVHFHRRFFPLRIGPIPLLDEDVRFLALPKLFFLLRTWPILLLLVLLLLVLPLVALSLLVLFVLFQLVAGVILLVVLQDLRIRVHWVLVVNLHRVVVVHLYFVPLHNESLDRNLNLRNNSCHDCLKFQDPHLLIEDIQPV